MHIGVRNYIIIINVLDETKPIQTNIALHVNVSISK